MTRFATVAGLMLLLGGAAYADTAQLTYSGDVATTAGLDITCSDSVNGDLWSINVRAKADQYGAVIQSFDDLTDLGDFSYAVKNGWMGMLQSTQHHSATFNALTFTELHKGADYYQYSILMTRTWSGFTFTINNVYTLNPADETGTQWTIAQTIANDGDNDIAIGGTEERMPMCLYLNADPHCADNGATLGDWSAEGVSIHETTADPDDPDAIYKITGNWDVDSPTWSATDPMWCQAEVLASDAAAALGLIPGRTFKMTTEFVTDASNTYHNVNLDNDTLNFWNQLVDYGQGNPLPAHTSITKTTTIDINIANLGAGEVGDPDASHSGVSAAPSPPATVLADGSDEATVTVILRDDEDQIVTGYDPSKIAVTATDTGADNSYGAVAEIGETGVYECTFTSLTAETKTVTVQVTLPDESTITLDDHPTVEFEAIGPADAGMSTVTAVPEAPDWVLANGASTAEVTITLRDVSDNPVSGKSADIDVSATDTGADNVYGTVTEPLAGSGVYRTTLASSTAETKTLTVQVDTGSGTVTLDDHPQVTFVALTDAELVYSGDDLAGALPAGDMLTMTIRCRRAGDQAPLWQMDLRRAANVGPDGQPGEAGVDDDENETVDDASELGWPGSDDGSHASIRAFDDLTDGGTFDYAGDVEGLFCFHKSHTIAFEQTFEEVYKGTDAYVYRVAETYVAYSFIGMVVTTTYHIYASDESMGTVIEADRVYTNPTDEPIASATYRTMADMNLGVGPYNGDELRADAYLDIYLWSGTEWTRDHLQADASPALYRTTDNIDYGGGEDPGNPGVDDDNLTDPMWGQAVVLDNAATQALGMTAGRTFLMTTTLETVNKDAYTRDVFLYDGTDPAQDRLGFHIYPQHELGMPNPCMPGQTYTEEGELVINLFPSEGTALGVLEIAAEVDPDEAWVYQNTQDTTQDRHVSTVTVTLVGEASPGEVYDISIADDGPDGANFTRGTVTDNRLVDDTMTVEIVGGRVGASTIGAGGEATVYNVTITFQGQTSGQSDSAQVGVSLLRIGDIDRDGSLTGSDRQLFNQRLNNVATGYLDRTFDLDGSGGAPTGTDKQVMNQALNNVALP